jgi:hypothetical protein
MFVINNTTVPIYHRRHDRFEAELSTGQASLSYLHMVNLVSKSNREASVTHDDGILSTLHSRYQATACRIIESTCNVLCAA